MSTSSSTALGTFDRYPAILIATLAALMVVVGTIATYAPAGRMVATRYHARQRTERFYQRSAVTARGASVSTKAVVPSSAALSRP